MCFCDINLMWYYLINFTIKTMDKQTRWEGHGDSCRSTQTLEAHQYFLLFNNCSTSRSWQQLMYPLCTAIYTPTGIPEAGTQEGVGGSGQAAVKCSVVTESTDTGGKIEGAWGPQMVFIRKQCGALPTNPWVAGMRSETQLEQSHCPMIYNTVLYFFFFSIHMNVLLSTAQL